MIRKSNASAIALPALTLAMLLVGNSIVNAQENFKLRLSHTYPSDHFLVSQAGAIFDKQVSEETAGRVSIDMYSSGQLGKDTLAVMSSGLAEIGFLIPSLLTDKLPLSEVTQLPNMFDSSCEGVALWRSAATGDGLLNQREYLPSGVKYLYSYVSPPYSMMTTKVATPTIESLSGLKIRGVGGPMTATVNALGAVPVSIASSEMYDSLSRGTIDGTIYSRMALKSLKLETSMKHTVDNVRLGTGNIFVGMTLDSWEKIPRDIQEVIERAAFNTEQSLCKWVDEQEKLVSEEMVNSLGWTITELPAEEVIRWEEKVNTVRTTWAKQMDQAGLSGTEVINNFLSPASTH